MKLIIGHQVKSNHKLRSSSKNWSRISQACSNEKEAGLHRSRKLNPSKLNHQIGCYKSLPSWISPYRTLQSEESWTWEDGPVLSKLRVLWRWLLLFVLAGITLLPQPTTIILPFLHAFKLLVLISLFKRSHRLLSINDFSQLKKYCPA